MTTRLESLPPDACMRLLTTHPVHVGRVVVVRGEEPHVYPVTFRVDRGAVVFRTADDGPLRDAAGSEVAFEVDAVDPAWQEGWSVLVHGVVREAVDEAELRRLRRLPLRPWAPGGRDRYMVIDPRSVSGRRII